LSLEEPETSLGQLAGIALEVTAIDLGGKFHHEVSNLRGGRAWELGHPVFGAIATGTWSFDPEFAWYEVTP
jgi:hypothetical protein